MEDKIVWVDPVVLKQHQIECENGEERSLLRRMVLINEQFAIIYAYNPQSPHGLGRVYSFDRSTEEYKELQIRSPINDKQWSSKALLLSGMNGPSVVPGEILNKDCFYCKLHFDFNGESWSIVSFKSQVLMKILQGSQLADCSSSYIVVASRFVTEVNQIQLVLRVRAKFRVVSFDVKTCCVGYSAMQDFKVLQNHDFIDPVFCLCDEYVYFFGQAFTKDKPTEFVGNYILGRLSLVDAQAEYEMLSLVTPEDLSNKISCARVMCFQHGHVFLFGERSYSFNIQTRTWSEIRFANSPLFISQQIGTLRMFGDNDDDVFIFRCSQTEVVIYKFRIQTSLVEPQSFRKESHSYLDRLYRNESLSDIVFVVDDHEFPAHSSVLSVCSSPYFEHLLTGAMREGTDGGKRTRLSHSIEIKGIEYEIFEFMMEFIYKNTIPKTMSLEVAFSLLLASERFSLEGMKILCLNHIESHLITDNSVLDLLGLLPLYDNFSWEKRLRAKCLSHVATHWKALRRSNSILWGSPSSGSMMSATVLTSILSVIYED